MDLTERDAGLTERFRSLKNEKSGWHGKPSVYALEHGLNADERGHLCTEILSQISHSGPKDSHYLSWVVYATEIGYSYSGNEYWQTFESRTPGWSDYGNRNRNWLREAFERFEQEYNGVKPSGIWADHFSIIS